MPNRNVHSHSRGQYQPPRQPAPSRRYQAADDFTTDDDPIDLSNGGPVESYTGADYEGSRSFRSTLDYQGYANEMDYDNEAWTSDLDFGHHGVREFQGRDFTGHGPKNYRRSDEKIHDEVCQQLTDAPGVDASDIEVKVHNGIVVLTGTVETRRMKRMAEDVVEAVRGVGDVQNHLKVESLNHHYPV